MSLWIINISCSEKKGKIQVSSAKLMLAILSSYNPSDLYRFLFEMSADHNYCVTRLRLQSLLKKITEIVDFLHEDSNFGQHLINSSLDNCFSLVSYWKRNADLSSKSNIFTYIYFKFWFCIALFK